MGEKPFREEVAQILVERDMSQRELARAIRRVTDWGTPGTISLLMSGQLVPTRLAMAAIAKGLHVKPERFAEYRMAKLRNELTPEKVGWAKALKTLKKIEGE